MLIPRAAIVVALLLLVSASAGAGQAEPGQAEEERQEAAGPDRAALFERFEKTMSGAKLTGKFTVVGKQQEGLKDEVYEIQGVQKLEQGDYWLFKARVKYGDKDIVVPMPLEVKWAGDTPVITLSETTLPGLGTFSARVVIHNDWYAGTWIHGKVGGHLFGTISREAAADEAEASP